MNPSIDTSANSQLLVVSQFILAKAQISALVRVLFGRHVRWMKNVLWFGLLLFSLSLFVASIPARFLQLRDEATLQGPVLEQLHIAPDLLPTLIMTLDVVALGTYLVVGVLIFWCKSGERVSFFASLALIVAGTTIVRPNDSLFFIEPSLRVPFLILFALGIGTIYALLYTLPDGHFVPRWTSWVVLLGAIHAVVTYLGPVTLWHTSRWPPPPLSPVILLFLVGGVASQVYRYRYASDRAQRQQTKWIVYGLAVGAIGLLSFQLVAPAMAPEVRDPGFDRLVYTAVGVPVLYLSLMLFPLTIGSSILFHRLWDIDVLINRTLLYGSLTAILAGLYAASITLFQKLFVGLTGQQSDLAIVLSTLIIAAAFTPLKDYMQKAIVRRWKDSGSGSRRFKELATQIESRISPVDPERLAVLLLQEAMARFDAQGGAVFLERQGILSLVHKDGEWNGDAKASADLTCEAQNTRLGMIALGARRGGCAYRKCDRDELQRIASVVAKAITEDQQSAQAEMQESIPDLR